MVKGTSVANSIQSPMVKGSDMNNSTIGCAILRSTPVENRIPSNLELCSIDNKYIVMGQEGVMFITSISAHLTQGMRKLTANRSYRNNPATLQMYRSIIMHELELRHFV